MGKYVHKFNTVSEKDAVYRGSDYLEPWLSYTVENDAMGYNKTEEDWQREYLTFNIVTGGTIVWDCNNVQKTISYSLNGGEWTSLTSTTSINVNAGDTLVFKGENSTYSTGTQRSKFGQDATATFNVSGNIMSLVYGDNFAESDTLTESYAFDMLFRYAKIISCKNLILPATTLTSNCYRYMFAGCTLLTDTPRILPATALTDYCYRYMFSGCTLLTTTPTILAETFSIESCTSMFYNCTSLTTISSIFPYARTMAKNSCSSMFSGCTSLTTFPALPAMTMGESCYYYMFRNCTSLTTTPELPATNLAQKCYNYMFSGCTSLITAHDLPATELTTSCYDSMFSGCTSLVNAPKLSATTLTTKCYYNMFYNCSSLTIAPELPAPKLVESCYEGMFYICPKLNYVKCMATSISASRCVTNWLNTVSETGTFVKASGMESWTTGANGIPTGWTVETASE